MQAAEKTGRRAVILAHKTKEKPKAGLNFSRPPRSAAVLAALGLLVGSLLIGGDLTGVSQAQKTSAFLPSASGVRWAGMGQVGGINVDIAGMTNFGAGTVVYTARDTMGGLSINFQNIFTNTLSSLDAGLSSGHARTSVQTVQGNTWVAIPSATGSTPPIIFRAPGASFVVGFNSPLVTNVIDIAAINPDAVAYARHIGSGWSAIGWLNDKGQVLEVPVLGTVDTLTVMGGDPYFTLPDRNHIGMVRPGANDGEKIVKYWPVPPGYLELTTPGSPYANGITAGNNNVFVAATSGKKILELRPADNMLCAYNSSSLSSPRDVFYRLNPDLERALAIANEFIVSLLDPSSASGACAMVSPIDFTQAVTSLQFTMEVLPATVTAVNNSPQFFPISTFEIGSYEHFGTLPSDTRRITGDDNGDTYVTDEDGVTYVPSADINDKPRIFSVDAKSQPGNMMIQLSPPKGPKFPATIMLMATHEKTGVTPANGEFTVEARTNSGTWTFEASSVSSSTVTKLRNGGNATITGQGTLVEKDKKGKIINQTVGASFSLTVVDGGPGAHDEVSLTILGTPYTGNTTVRGQRNELLINRSGHFTVQ